MSLLTYLKGEYTHKELYPAYNIGRFAITNQNEHPEATMRWNDYFYGDGGSKLAFMGIEGETYEKTSDGEYIYTWIIYEIAKKD